MSNVIHLNRSNFVKYLILYFIVMLASNYFRISIVINYLVSKSVEITLITGNISSVISSVFIILLLLAIITTCYFIRDVFFQKISNETIFDSIKTVIILFIFIELARIFLIYFILIDEVKKIDVSRDIMEQLNNTDWYNYNSYINIFIIVFGSFLFGIQIYDKENKITPSIAFSLVFLLGFYLVNTNL